MAFPYSDLNDPNGQVLAVTPADALLPSGLTRNITANVTTAGNLAIVTASGNAVTLTLPIGHHKLPIRARQISATGTTVVGQVYACY